MVNMLHFPILENYKVKLTAFVVAILFWFAVVTESSYQYDMEVAIVPINVPEDRIIVSGELPKAKVRFEGRGKTLLGLVFNEKTLELNLSDIKADAYLPLEQAILHIARRSQDQINWQVLSPDTVYIKMAYLERKRVPVVPQIEIEPAAGYIVVGPVQVTPDSVLITGPVRQIQKIDRLMTETRHFSEMQRDVRGRVALLPLADSLKIRIAWRQVEFHADVQKLLEFQLDELPVEVINVPRRWRITPRPSRVSITVIGGEELLMRLTPEDFRVFVDYKQKQDRDTRGYRPQIQHVPDVTVPKIIPEFIKLEIERKGTR